MIDPTAASSRQRLRPGWARPILRIAFLVAILVAVAGTLAASPASAAPIAAGATSHINATAAASSSSKLHDTICGLFYCGPATISASWQAQAGTGTGTVTVQGAGFTPGGVVRIIYNYGGGYYEQFATASQSYRDCVRPGVCFWVVGGYFTATEPGISCGAIPGEGGIGVIVDAFDLTSGADPQQGIPTPCQ